MEEKPKMKNTAEEAPSRISTSIMSEKQATARSGLRTSNNQSSQSLVMQLQQQAAQISTITGGVSSSSPAQSSVAASQQHSPEEESEVASNSTTTHIPEYSSMYHLPSVMNHQNTQVDMDDPYDDHPRDSRDEHELREQDRFLPIANVARIMKKGIPETGKIAKDAKECVQECVSEFISFITSEASERCQQEKRKTINGEDILFAMTTLGFDNYVEPLKVYLTKYRESLKGEKVLNEYSHGVEGTEDSSALQYQYHQIAGNSSIQPTMVTADGASYTYATQAQINSQIQFNT